MSGEAQFAFHLVVCVVVTFPYLGESLVDLVPVLVRERFFVDPRFGKPSYDRIVGLLRIAPEEIEFLFRGFIKSNRGSLHIRVYACVHIILWISEPFRFLVKRHSSYDEALGAPPRHWGIPPRR